MPKQGCSTSSRDEIGSLKETILGLSMDKWKQALVVIIEGEKGAQRSISDGDRMSPHPT